MDDSLPEHLTERFRWVVAPNQTNHGAGEFVLYWMHNALRAHENPALDVAICFARQNGLPLLVYHGLSEDYPYASDRYHAFILQGDRDVQRELRDRGIASFFNLQHRGNRGPHLRDLTRRAAVLITEEMPVQPLSGWMQRLVSKTTTPIATVDASCIVSPIIVDQCYERAFAYRDATKSLYAERINRDYPEQTVDCEMFDGPLPFEPRCLQDTCLSALIAKCDVDHCIAPVADTPGGSRAGYARWNLFKENGLSKYAKRRNDAAVHNGVSRMSAYLHFGMVSPFRIAREAHAQHAEKYLDELLIWRELSFHYCYHNIDVIDSVDALPKWAQSTLTEHAADARKWTYSWEKLARGRTGQPLWDLCQQSLLRHGELHNNARMTWGKAFLQWTRSPCQSVHLTMDINHRYALDGRDPSSYGGVLWCYGLFDRPFEPEQEVIGAIRPRPIEHHQSRLDLCRFKKVVHRPISGTTPRVAVIGAGIAGLMAARTLHDHGFDVQVIDKSRGVGGRAATRRCDDNLSFDHGAQYFTARDPRFTRYVQSWIQDGIVAPWMGKIVELGAGGKVLDQKTGTPRYVGTPGMSAIGKHLASDLNVILDRCVTALHRDGQQWRIKTDHGELDDCFDRVIVNCPPEQTLAIVDGHTEIARQIEQVSMNPCWSLMLIADECQELEFDGAFINDGPLSWIARNDNKPARVDRSGRAWVLHASAEWSKSNLESDPEHVQAELLAAFSEATGLQIQSAKHIQSHRWRYAIPATPLEEEFLFDPTTGIGACGDWCGGPRVEGAFLSGMAVAGAMMRHLTIDRPVASSTTRQPSLF